MEKAQVREQAKAHLAALTDEQRAIIMQTLVKTVTELPAWRAANTVALTMSQDVELPTQLLIQTALLQGKRVGLPRVQPQRQLSFVAITEATTYERHRFGMLEPVGDDIIDPAEFDLVIVPGLTFTTDGQRLGFGGGYYDRWLPKTKATTIGIGLKANVFEQAPWPVEGTDVVLDRVVVL